MPFKEYLPFKIDHLRLQHDGPIKAFVDVNFDDLFIIKSFRVVQGAEKMFIAPPAEQLKNRWCESFKPVDQQYQVQLYGTIMFEYHKARETYDLAHPKSLPPMPKPDEKTHTDNEEKKP